LPRPAGPRLTRFESEADVPDVIELLRLTATGDVPQQLFRKNLGA
jgi:hypothetical protein